MGGHKRRRRLTGERAAVEREEPSLRSESRGQASKEEAGWGTQEVSCGREPSGSSHGEQPVRPDAEGRESRSPEAACPSSPEPSSISQRFLADDPATQRSREVDGSSPHYDQSSGFEGLKVG